MNEIEKGAKNSKETKKMGRLSDSAFRRCIELFLLAGEQEARDGSLPAPCDIAWELLLSIWPGLASVWRGDSPGRIYLTSEPPRIG